MSAQDWVASLAATPDDPDAVYDKSPGSRGWLVNLLDSEDGWDTLRRLRAILLAFPYADVTIDVTWLGEYGWRESEPAALASNAQAAVRDKTTVHAPVIVLTEGTTDAEFLSTALSVLHPHLTDLVRFLDYERKPEGGASAVLRAVRAFGVTHRSAHSLASFVRTHERSPSSLMTARVPPSRTAARAWFRPGRARPVPPSSGHNPAPTGNQVTEREGASPAPLPWSALAGNTRVSPGRSCLRHVPLYQAIVRTSHVTDVGGSVSEAMHAESRRRI
jgi:hypothetical protein